MSKALGDRVPKEPKPSKHGVKTGGKTKGGEAKPTIIPQKLGAKKSAVIITGLIKSGNAVRFTLTIADPLIAHYIEQFKNEEGDEKFELVAIQTNVEDYAFELHPGHTTGNPIYIRMAGNADKTNVPKFDTKNIDTAPKWAKKKNLSDADFANPEKITLSTGKRDAMITLIAQNWTVLQRLAVQAYEVDGIV